MSNARLLFIKDILEKVHKIQFNPVFNPSLPYHPGNCAEYLTFGVLLWNQERYRTLCLSIPKNQIFASCDHFQKMADAVREKGLEVSDLWNESFLVDPNDINPSTNSIQELSHAGLKDLEGPVIQEMMAMYRADEGVEIGVCNRKKVYILV